MKPTHALHEAEVRPSTSVKLLPIRTGTPSRDASPSSAISNPTHNAKRKSHESIIPWRTFAVVSSIPIALSVIIILAFAAEDASQSYLNGRDCYPNGMWKEAAGASWRIMDSSYFFTPNLAFGAMTFTQVKVIDIAWDLIVGRGGQMLLAWVNYRVFNEWLLYHMEQHRTSYKMYTSVAFQTTTLRTLGVLGKEWLAFGEKSWKRFFRWLAMLCMMLATLYVLAYPTLMAAMTGYISTYKPYVEDEHGNLVAWSEAKRVNYVVQDSWRLEGNYSAPLVAVDDDVDLKQAIYNYTGYYGDIRFGFSSGVTSSTLRNISSTFVLNGVATYLDAPTLNITYANIFDETDHMMYPYYSLNASRQGAFFSLSYLQTHGSCQPNKTYQWGFSYIFLFMVSIFNFIWSCVMVSMWLDTRRHSRMYKGGRRPGLLRSILDVAAAIKEEVGWEQVDGDSLTEKELRKRLVEGRGALVVPKGELRVARSEGNMDMEVRKRGWRERMTEGSTF